MTKNPKEMPDVIVVLSYPEASAARAALDMARYDHENFTEQERRDISDAYKTLSEPLDATWLGRPYAAREAVAEAYSVLEGRYEDVWIAADGLDMSEAMKDLKKAFGKLVKEDE